MLSALSCRPSKLPTLTLERSPAGQGLLRASYELQRALWAPSTAGFRAVPSRSLYPVVWLEERQSAVPSSSFSLWPCCRLPLCPWASHFLSRASLVSPNKIRGPAPRLTENVKHVPTQTSCYCFLSFALRCNNCQLNFSVYSDRYMVICSDIVRKD